MQPHDSTDRHARSSIERFEPPGGILVWIIVFLELVTFAAGFAVFVFQGRENPAVFDAGRASLNQPIALANTFILLTGGWCMANSILLLRQGRKEGSARWMAGAIATGIGFIILKSFEYSQKFGHGIGLGNDTFFTLYYLLTGFHLIHVFVAAILLVVMLRGARRGRYDADHHQDVESVGIFWHLCDLIWLLLYPIIYLL